MKKRFLPLAVLVLFVVSLCAGCKPGDGSSSGGGTKLPTGSKVTGDLAFPELNKLTGSTFTILGTDITVSDEDKELLKNEYGLEPKVINVAYDEVFKRAATLVLTDDSPDMIRVSRGGHSYISNNIAQPIDEYIDFTHPFYKDLLDAYDETKWGEKEHYFLIRGLQMLSGMIYNSKMFEDAGLENPWEQYQNGTWDWNAFREAANELADDTDGDGQTDVYGFGFYRPQIFGYTTGKPFGMLNTDTMTVTNNLRDADIARAMNLIYDMTYVDKSGLNNVGQVVDTFGQGKLGMLIFDINVIGLPEIQKVVDKGEAGLAPLPRDPNLDTHYSYSVIVRDIIPKGAKNPQGAIAYNAVERYNALNNENSTKAVEKRKTEQHFTDELEAQFQELHTIEASKVQPLYDDMELIGYNATWDCIYSGLAWATAIENRSAEADAYIAELLEVKEVDLPSGPKNLELFEKYTVGENEPIPSTKLYSITGGNPNFEIYLDKENAHEGNYAGKIYYSFDPAEGDWGGFTKNLNITWNTNNTMTFWAKGDGKPQTVIIQFVANGVPWEYTMDIDGAEGKVYEIPFTDFKVVDWWEDQSVTLDLTLIDNISFSFKGEGDRFIYLDDIRVIRK